MLIQELPPLHLTYCLNIHRGESWAENFEAIRTKTLAVRERVAPGKKFGLGLRLSHRASLDLADPKTRAEAKRFFDENDLYAFTVNGFPYGNFHEGRVKENVYAPDWQTTERRDYTNLLADILLDFLPDGMRGSISTVPGSFKAWITQETQVEAMTQMIMESVAHLHRIRERTGTEIQLALEPEPSCFLETTEETVRFFNEWLLRSGVDILRMEIGCSTADAEVIIRRHLGVCFDTCHVAIQFENLAESLRKYRDEGISIPKVQISAALKTAPENWRALEPFCEEVYLHQVKAREKSGRILAWHDLDLALREHEKIATAEELRVHFHVPLFFEGNDALQSTAAAMDTSFWREIRNGISPHLEIETYTFDVLPTAMRTADMSESIFREYKWTLAGLNA